MRIAVVSMTACDITRASRVFREVATLKEAGHEVMVVSAIQRQDKLATSDQYDGVPIQRFRVEVEKQTIVSQLIKALRMVAMFTGLSHYGVMVLFTKQAHPLLKKFRPDVVHAHNLAAMPLAYWCKRKYGSKVIYDSHELWLDRNIPKGIQKLQRSIDWVLERFFINRADITLAVGDEIAQAIESRYHVPVEVVYNYPVANDAYQSLREHLHIPRDRKIILYLGGIVPNRGVEQSIQVLQRLPDYALVMMGYYLEVAYYRSILKLSGEFRDRIYFMPSVPFDKVTAWAASADVGVMFQTARFKSYELSFPNKLLESVSAGIPVVVNKDCSVMAEFVKKHNVGVCVDVNDLDDIAHGITEATTNSLYKQNAKALVINWETEGAKLLRIYGGLGCRKRR